MYSNSPEMHRNKTNTIGKLNLQFSKHSRLWQLLLHLHLVVQHVAGVLGGVGQVHLKGRQHLARLLVSFPSSN